VNASIVNQYSLHLEVGGFAGCLIFVFDECISASKNFAILLFRRQRKAFIDNLGANRRKDFEDGFLQGFKLFF